MQNSETNWRNKKIISYCSLSYEQVSSSDEFLLNGTKHRPKIAIICGSGLGSNYLLFFNDIKISWNMVAFNEQFQL